MTAYTATVTVRLKRGVLDPEAETTKQALERLGFELEELRAADRFEVDLEADSADARASERTRWPNGCLRTRRSTITTWRSTSGR